MQQVLVIADAPQLRWALQAGLQRAGYGVELAGTGEEGLDVMAERPPDLVVLDVSMPGIDGFEVCRQLRRWSRVPVIMLTVRDSGADKIRALNLGADDYLTKPFSLDELIARIRAVLRRTVPIEGAQSPCVEVGELAVDLSRRSVRLAGEEVHLTPIEYEIVATLIRNPDRVITHQQLIERVWGSPGAEEPSTLRVHIARLRSKIEADPTRPRYIHTEPRDGYRLRLVY